ncbi:hypothetical protein HUU61_02905 [Rhodopseudomonas palustris]|nr:hypothetical protein [Rhodopseudomonas palustris]
MLSILILQRSRRSITAPAFRSARNLDRRDAALGQQPDVAGMNLQHAAITAACPGDVDFVQAAAGITLRRLVVAAEIVVVQRNEARPAR